MANGFCKQLSNGVRFYVDDGVLSYHPCCYWQGPKLDPIDYHKDRLWIDNPDPWAHSECSKCKEEESYKGSSLRLNGNRTIADNATKIAWLDLQADITCNGGCLICGSWNSSFWTQENFKNNDGPAPQKKPDLAKIVDDLFTAHDLSELQLLQFLGGEPFLSDLDEIATKHIPNPQNCVLKYTTNGSVYPSKERIESWSKFKSVVLTLSIDGIGDQFEYLRYPLKWDIVNANVQRIIKELPNVKLTINHSVTPLNAFYFDRFMNWVTDTFPVVPNMHVHPAYGTMGVEYTPESIRKLIADKYEPDHVICKMLASNKIMFNADFIAYVAKFDARRGTSVQDTFPELFKVLT